MAYRFLGAIWPGVFLGLTRRDGRLLLGIAGRDWSHAWLMGQDIMVDGIAWVYGFSDVSLRRILH